MPDQSVGAVSPLEVKESATVREVMQSLGIPANVPIILMINNRQAGLGDVLDEGDLLTFFPPMGGG